MSEEQPSEGSHHSQSYISSVCESMASTAQAAYDQLPSFGAQPSKTDPLELNPPNSVPKEDFKRSATNKQSDEGDKPLTTKSSPSNFHFIPHQAAAHGPNATSTSPDKSTQLALKSPTSPRDRSQLSPYPEDSDRSKSAASFSDSNLVPHSPDESFEATGSTFSDESTKSAHSALHPDPEVKLAGRSIAEHVEQKGIDGDSHLAQNQNTKAGSQVNPQAQVDAPSSRKLPPHSQDEENKVTEDHVNGNAQPLQPQLTNTVEDKKSLTLEENEQQNKPNKNDLLGKPQDVPRSDEQTTERQSPLSPLRSPPLNGSQSTTKKEKIKHKIVDLKEKVKLKLYN